MKSNVGRLDQWCCYCGEPTSFEHIGNELSAIQRFVDIRSGGRVFFNFRNSVLNNTINDVCIFNCISCKGLSEWAKVLPVVFPQKRLFKL